MPAIKSTTAAISFDGVRVFKSAGMSWEDLVVAIQSLWPEPFTNELAEHRRAFVNAVVKTVSGRQKTKK